LRYTRNEQTQDKVSSLLLHTNVTLSGDVFMKKTSTILMAAGLLFVGSEAVQAQEKGALFHNGLTANITEAYASRAEKCDIFLCGKWERIDNPERVLAPNAEAMILVLAALEEQKEKVCKWDIKIVTQPVEGGATAEHVFRMMDFCQGGGRSRVSFNSDENGTFASQTYTDAQGQEQTVRVMSGQ
jgi:hypothetical protein